MYKIVNKRVALRRHIRRINSNRTVVPAANKYQNKKKHEHRMETYLYMQNSINVQKIEQRLWHTQKSISKIVNTSQKNRSLVYVGIIHLKRNKRNKPVPVLSVDDCGVFYNRYRATRCGLDFTLELGNVREQSLKLKYPEERQ